MNLLALNTPQQTPKVMIEMERSYWFEEAVWTRSCTGCKRVGTQKVVRIIGDNADQTHALVRCFNERCNWNDCTLHLVFNRPEFAATLGVHGGSIDVPKTMVKPSPQKKPTVGLGAFLKAKPTTPKRKSLFDL